MAMAATGSSSENSAARFLAGTLEAANVIDYRRNSSRLAYLRRRDRRAANRSRRCGLEDAQHKSTEAGTDRALLSARGTLLPEHQGFR